MSATLLQRVSAHLAAANLLDGYDVQYLRYTDANTQGPLVMFRMAGSEGALTDFTVQYPDVTMIMIATPTTAVSASERMREIVQFMRDDFQGDGLLYIEPLSAVMGPYYMEDGRPWFQLEIRVIVNDH